MNLLDRSKAWWESFLSEITGSGKPLEYEDHVYAMAGTDLTPDPEDDAWLYHPDAVFYFNDEDDDPGDFYIVDETADGFAYGYVYVDDPTIPYEIGKEEFHAGLEDGSIVKSD